MKTLHTFCTLIFAWIAWGEASAQTPHTMIYGAYIFNKDIDAGYGGGLTYESPVFDPIYLGANLEYWQGRTDDKLAGKIRTEVLGGNLFGRFYPKLSLRWLKPYLGLGFGGDQVSVQPKSFEPERKQAVGFAAEAGFAVSHAIDTYFLDYRYRGYGKNDYAAVCLGISSFIR